MSELRNSFKVYANLFTRVAIVMSKLGQLLHATAVSVYESHRSVIFLAKEVVERSTLGPLVEAILGV